MASNGIPEPGTLISAKEVGKYLGVTARTVIRLAESGELPAYRIGGGWRFNREDVKTYLEAHRYQPDKNTDEDQRN